MSSLKELGEEELEEVELGRGFRESLVHFDSSDGGVLDVLLDKVWVSAGFAQLHHQVREVGLLLDERRTSLVALLNVADELLDEIRVRPGKTGAARQRLPDLDNIIRDAQHEPPIHLSLETPHRQGHNDLVLGRQLEHLGLDSTEETVNGRVIRSSPGSSACTGRNVLGLQPFA